MKKIIMLSSVAILFGASALSACNCGNPGGRRPVAYVFQTSTPNCIGESCINTAPVYNYSSDENPSNPPNEGQGNTRTMMREAIQQHPELLQNIRQALMNNPNIDATSIRVTTTPDGRVTLIGIVRDNATKDAATTAVQNLPGVNGVDNQLTPQQQ